MRVGFIGDIVGKPGREMIKEYAKSLKDDHSIDVLIANAENASHGFGLSIKNSEELFKYGIDVITGGNHIWDKKDIIPIMNNIPVLRPLNYPKESPGKGTYIYEKDGEKLAIINLMGHFTMPLVDNVFLRAKDEIEIVKKSGINNIFIDFHAEATSEKRAIFCFLKGKVSAICGTHTHIGTDDLMIEDGTFYVSDVGLCGCRDGVIGMDKDAPLKRFTTGLPSSFDIPKKCKKILQIVIFDLDNGECKEAYKIKIYDNKDEKIFTRAIKE